MNNPLSYSKVRFVDIDSPERTFLHSRIIQNKPFLRRLYIEWYERIKNFFPDRPCGGLVELGAGGGFSKLVISNVITTEILSVPDIDVRLDGEVLPFKDSSLKGIFMVDVFHHLPRAEKFLEEAARCIKPGGILVMIEPWNTFFSRIFYRYLHHEPFEEDTPTWQLAGGGPLSRANSALPWIVFKRDRRIFEAKWPEWRIDTIELHTPFRYLLSGGLSTPSLMPVVLFDFWHDVERLLQPLMGCIALFATIVLVRQSSTV